jgi:DNA-binding CsgD family transcriptional regulator
VEVGLALRRTGRPAGWGAARGIADIERLLLPTVLRQKRIRPDYRRPGAGAGAWRRIFVPLRDAQSRLDLAHGVLKLAVALITFVVTVTWWAGALVGTLYWAYDWALPHPEGNQVVGQLLVRRRRDDPLRELTPREREVLALMAEGHSNTAIARALVVTDGAVEKHVRNIFTKLGLPPDTAQHRRVLAVLTYLRT